MEVICVKGYWKRFFLSLPTDKHTGERTAGGPEATIVSRSIRKHKNTFVKMSLSKFIGNIEVSDKQTDRQTVGNSKPLYPHQSFDLEAEIKSVEMA